MSAWKWMSAAARTQAVKDSRNRTAAHIAAHYGAPLQSVQAIIDRLGSNTDEGQPRPPESPACDGTPTPATAEHAPGDGGPDGGSSTVAGATSDGGGEDNAVASAPANAARAPAEPATSSPPPQTRREKVTRPQKRVGAPRVHFTSQKQPKTLVPARGRLAAAPAPEKQPAVKSTRVAEARKLRPASIAPKQAEKRQKTRRDPDRHQARAEPLPPEPKGIPEPNEVSVTIHIDRRTMDVVQSRARKAAWTRAQMISAIVTQACNKG